MELNKGQQDMISFVLLIVARILCGNYEGTILSKLQMLRLDEAQQHSITTRPISVSVANQLTMVESQIILCHSMMPSMDKKQSEILTNEIVRLKNSHRDKLAQYSKLHK